MEPLDRIKAIIPKFPGYADEESRRLSDEEIRAFVGEKLSKFASQNDSLPPEDRDQLERALMRCEFANQEALSAFAHVAPENRISATLDADNQIIDAAHQIDELQGSEGLLPVLNRLEDAFDARDAAMQL